MMMLEVNLNFTTFSQTLQSAGEGETPSPFLTMHLQAYDVLFSAPRLSTLSNDAFPSFLFYETITDMVMSQVNFYSA